MGEIRMKILYYTWNENSQIDIIDVLMRMGHQIVKCQIPFSNYEIDENCTYNLEKIFCEKNVIYFYRLIFFH